jgi:phosphate:Na+ symporter
MKNFLNLFSAIALLVWGTYLARTGILGVFGGDLRQILSRSFGTRHAALLAGFGVTALVQSSTATALIVSSFVGQGLVTLSTAFAAMLGADIGTSLMTVVFSFDLSWLSPLFILVGVVLFVSRQATTIGRIGRVLIGLGLMLLALRLISESTTEIVGSNAVRTILGSLKSDILLEITMGALLTVLAYSSLAIVLLTATLAATGAVPVDVAIGLILGANLGGGLLAVFVTAKSSIEVRQVPLGNFFFKVGGVILAAPFANYWPVFAGEYFESNTTVVVMFHLCLNLAIAILFLPFTDRVSKFVRFILPLNQTQDSQDRLNHLDQSALATPELAISCAAREALHQADIVETMLRGVLKVIKDDDIRLSEELRKLDDKVDDLYTAIKYYLTKVSRNALDENESRRWSDIVTFTINMEQIADIIERVLLDIEEKKIKKNRNFSEAGMSEICDLHTCLLDNLQLAMSVFLNGSVRDATKLLQEKTRFRDLERVYAGNHIDRLSDNTLQSIETSSLHLDLISELKRINSHICSIAYPILDSAGVLAPNRLVNNSNLN